MNSLETFLRDHAFVHTVAVAPAFPFNIDPLLNDLSETQRRARPHGLNSVAWLLWHLARVEDGCVSMLVLGQSQLLDEDHWHTRLGIGRRDLGTGMTKAEVAEMSERIVLDQLVAYRDAVGRRTRALLPSLWPDRWNAFVDPADIDRAAEAAVVSEPAAAAMRQFLPSQTREAALHWWGLHHSLMHLGQLAMLRGLLIGTNQSDL
jgi:hypothetical protein